MGIFCSFNARLSCPLTGEDKENWRFSAYSELERVREALPRINVAPPSQDLLGSKLPSQVFLSRKGRENNAPFGQRLR
jgi:hypothetical protein